MNAPLFYRLSGNRLGLPTFPKWGSIKTSRSQCPSILVKKISKIGQFDHGVHVELTFS